MQLTWNLDWALSRTVKEMAVAAMAWVEGSPYSTSTRVSSLTTGGDGGRGSFSRSFVNWPMYITIWRRADRADVGRLVGSADESMLKNVSKSSQHGLEADALLWQLLPSTVKEITLLAAIRLQRFHNVT